MKDELSLFKFIENLNELDLVDSVIAIIPKEITNREFLFKVLMEKLSLPEYFGMNWDALSDCLRDFSWLDSRRIAIIHEGIPEGLSSKELQTYLEILIECLQDWQPEDEHELIVTFPYKCRQKIEDHF